MGFITVFRTATFPKLLEVVGGKKILVSEFLSHLVVAIKNENDLEFLILIKNLLLQGSDLDVIQIMLLAGVDVITVRVDDVQMARGDERRRRPVDSLA